VELLKEIAPHIARATLLFNPPTAPFVQDYLTSFRAAAASVGLEAIVAPINEMSELQSRFATQTSEPKNGLVVIPDAFTQHYLAEIAEVAARYHVPAIDWSRSFTEVGGLISYGPYLVEEYRRAASYADRILKGEKPSDLPVQAPVKFELVINLKTAKALGLTVPASLLVRADEVIE
jgi:putative ABC transport system substrate-binding protein